MKPQYYNNHKKDIPELNDECSGCDFYEKHLRGKSYYLGDSPCERCNKYHDPKITC
jgi:hypothetical protein